MYIAIDGDSVGTRLQQYILEERLDELNELKIGVGKLHRYGHTLVNFQIIWVSLASTYFTKLLSR